MLSEYTDALTGLLQKYAGLSIDQAVTDGVVAASLFMFTLLALKSGYLLD